MNTPEHIFLDLFMVGRVTQACSSELYSSAELNMLPRASVPRQSPPSPRGWRSQRGTAVRSCWGQGTPNWWACCIWEQCGRWLPCLVWEHEALIVQHPWQVNPTFTVGIISLPLQDIAREIHPMLSDSHHAVISNEAELYRLAHGTSRIKFLRPVTGLADLDNSCDRCIRLIWLRYCVPDLWIDSIMDLSSPELSAGPWCLLTLDPLCSPMIWSWPPFIIPSLACPPHISTFPWG